MKNSSLALISEDVRWSRGEIESAALKLRNRLETELPDIQQSKIILYITEPLHILTSINALGQEPTECLIVDPTDGVAQLADLWNDTEICILTEKQYHEELPAFHHVMLLDFPDKSWQDFSDSREWVDRTRLPMQLKLQFLGMHGGPDPLIDNVTLESTFIQLDKLLHPKPDDLFMPLPGLPYKQVIIDLLWAFSRKICLLNITNATPDQLDLYVMTDDIFPMEFGLFYFGAVTENIADQTGKYDTLIETVKYADEQEFGSIWTPERHFNSFGGLFPNPSVISAALATVTKQIEIRCGSIVSPLHHPVRIAEDWSVVDNLSGGRTALSFASGWQCDDFVLNPDKFTSRESEMYKQIEIIRKLWRGDQVGFKNGLGKEIEVSIFPKPVQTEIPVWITASGNINTFMEAGRIGANVLTHLLYQGNEGIEEKVNAYRKSLKQHGFEPHSGKVTVMVHTFLGSDKEEVKSVVKPLLKKYLQSSADLIKAMTKSKDNLTGQNDVIQKYMVDEEDMTSELFEELLEMAFERLFEKASLLGTLESAAGMLKKLKKAGVDEVACLIDFGLGHEEIMKGLSYLSILRKKYDQKLINRYRVTLTHCTSRAMDIMSNGQNNHSKKFLAGLRKVMVNGSERAFSETEIGMQDKVERVDWHIADSRESLSLVHSIDRYSDEAGNDLSQAFNSIVSEDF